MTSNRGLLGLSKPLISQPTAVVAPIVPIVSNPLGSVASSGAIVQTVSAAPTSGVAAAGALLGGVLPTSTVTSAVSGVTSGVLPTTNALPTDPITPIVNTVSGAVASVVPVVTETVNAIVTPVIGGVFPSNVATANATSPVPTLPNTSIPDVLPTVVNIIAPLAPVVVDLPQNPIVQPVAEFLQSINPDPFPQPQTQTQQSGPLPDPITTVIGVVSPVFPIVVDLPPNPITTPIVEFLQDISQPPFPQGDAIASPNAVIAPIPVNIPLPVGVPINGLLPITVPFVPLPVEIPGAALNGLVPTTVLTPILNPVAQITDPIVAPVLATVTNAAQILSPVGTTFNTVLNTASPVLVPIIQTEQMLNPLGESVNAAITTLGPILNITSGVVSAIDPVGTSIQNTVNVVQPVIDIAAAETVNAAPVVALATGAVGALTPVTGAVTSTLDSLNAPLTGTLGSVVAPVVALAVGAAAPVVAAAAGVLDVVLPPVNETVAATVSSAVPVLNATAQFVADNVNPIILIGPQDNNLQASAQSARTTFPATPNAYIEEFYAQLKLLHGFFTMTGIKYWLTGGSLLGQYREKRFLRWGDSNAIGVMAQDGPMIYEKLRAYLKVKMPAYEIWNSVHGLKLVNKSMKGVATDIYYYAANGPMYALSSDRSRKQWPKDLFVPQDLMNLQLAPFGGLMLPVPQNPQSYLASIYGPRFMNFARLNTFDHFANAGRLLAIVEVALLDILMQ